MKALTYIYWLLLFAVIVTCLRDIWWHDDSHRDILIVSCGVLIVMKIILFRDEMRRFQDR